MKHEREAELAKFSSCDVADALVELGFGSSCHVQGVSMQSPKADESRKLCAPAFTIQMIEQHETPLQSFEPGSHYVDSIPKGSVAVISTPATCSNAVWGGLLTVRATKIGIEGCITDGYVRDILELRQFEFPVFARSTSCHGAKTFAKVSSLGGSIKLNGLVNLNTGDYIVADIDGVMVVPRDMIDRVIDICTRNFSRDQKCLADLSQGHSLSETFKKYRS